MRHGVNLTWRSYLMVIPFLPFAYFVLLYIQAIREYFTVRSFYHTLDLENKELLDTIKHLPREIPEMHKRAVTYFNS